MQNDQIEGNNTKVYFQVLRVVTHKSEIFKKARCESAAEVNKKSNRLKSGGTESDKASMR